MSDSSLDDSHSSSPSLDSKRPFKRRRLSTSASSDSDSAHKSDLKLSHLEKEVAALRARLSKSEATAMEYHNKQREITDKFQKMKNKLMMQARLDTMRIEKLEENLEARVRQADEAREAQAVAEAELLRLKSIIEGKVTALMIDLKSEGIPNSSRLQGDHNEIQDEIKRENEDESIDQQAMSDDDQPLQTDSNPQNTDVNKKSSAGQTMKSERSSCEEQGISEAEERHVKKLKREPQLQEMHSVSINNTNVKYLIDLTQEPMPTTPQELNDSKRKKPQAMKQEQKNPDSSSRFNDHELSKNQTCSTSSEYEVSRHRQVKMISGQAEEDVKPRHDYLQVKNHQLQRKQETNRNTQGFNIQFDKTDSSYAADDEKWSSEDQNGSDSSPDIFDGQSGSQHVDFNDEGHSFSEASDKKLFCLNPSLQASIISSDGESDGENLQGSHWVTRRKYRRSINIGKNHHVLVSSRFFEVNFRQEYSRLEWGQWACNKCPRILKNEQRAEDHVWVEHYGGKYECPHCTRSRTFFSCRQSIRVHNRKQHSRLHEAMDI